MAWPRGSPYKERENYRTGRETKRERKKKKNFFLGGNVRREIIRFVFC